MPSALIPLASFRVLLASALGMKGMIHSTDDASSNGAILGFPQEFLDRQAKAYTYADYICEYKSSLGRPSFVVLECDVAVFCEYDCYRFGSAKM